MKQTHMQKRKRKEMYLHSVRCTFKSSTFVRALNIQANGQLNATKTNIQEVHINGNEKKNKIRDKTTKQTKIE